MKSFLSRAALYLCIGYLLIVAWQAYVGASFVTDSSMVGPDVWNDRRQVVATTDRPVIPAQLPGPLDAWAGPGPKEIVLKIPGKGKTVIDFSFLDSHESAPPNLEILFNGATVTSAQLKKGAGVNSKKWKDSGRSSRLSITIPKNIRTGKSNTLVIRNTKGSWVAFDKISIKEVATPLKLAGLLLAILLLLGWRLLARRREKAFGSAPATSSIKYAIFAAITIIFSSSIALIAGEVALRIIYNDGGKTTSEGPGGKGFNYTFLGNGERFASNGLPKKPEGQKIFIQGDSITYGWGVRDWEAIYPNILYKKLVEANEKYEVAVKAIPNRELDFHRAKLYEMADNVDPDIIIYQWYNNDIELEYCHTNQCGMPENKTSFWRKFAMHEWLKGHSYLYFFLDIRLAMLRPDYNRSYIEYLTDDFAEGTMKGQRFRTEFYRWATVATAYADRVIVMLYPAVPFSGENPFRAQHDMMKKLSKPHTFHIAAYTTSKNTGGDYFTEGDGTNHIARRAKVGIDKPGLLVDAPPIPIREGQHKVSFSLKTGEQIFETVAIIEVLQESTGAILAKRRLSGKDFISKAKWQDFTLNFEIKERLIKDLRFRVWYEGGADIAVDQISLPVDRKLELIDLIPHLSGIDTYASDFDWHPNEKAHKVMAQVLYDLITNNNDENN